MLDCLIDGLMDTLKIIPYLFITFLVLEFMEHKMTKKSEKLMEKNQKFGPIIGGILGALPQCGFSSMCANLFSGRVLTMGTLIAVFLSTSDEMLPIMISEKVDPFLLLRITGFKVIVGIIVGYFVDFIYRKKEEKTEHIHELCEHDHCSCEHENLFLSSLKHTIKIGLFILIANLAIGLIIYYVGEDNLSKLLLHKNIFTYFVASLIGLIPNCASSVIMTELYLSNIITIGTLIGGLLTGSGIGLLLLFRTNKNMKENVSVLSIIYLTGVFVGFLIDIIL